MDCGLCRKYINKVKLDAVGNIQLAHKVALLICGLWVGQGTRLSKHTFIWRRIGIKCHEHMLKFMSTASVLLLKKWASCDINCHVSITESVYVKPKPEQVSTFWFFFQYFLILTFKVCPRLPFPIFLMKFKENVQTCNICQRSTIEIGTKVNIQAFSIDTSFIFFLKKLTWKKIIRFTLNTYKKN